MNTLQSIFNNSIDTLPSMPSYKRKALLNIMTCKTEAAGKVVRSCNSCNHVVKYNRSCGSRYCNQCGYFRKALWIEDRLDECLPVQYFFATFTIPEYLRVLFLYNEKVCYKEFFKSTAEAIKSVCKHFIDPGIKTGFSSFLHTWDQAGNYHPHIHILIPGGGISEDECEWVSCKKNFFMPSYALRAVFKAKFIDALLVHYNKDRLVFPDTLNTFGDKDSDKFKRFLQGKDKYWCVNIQAGEGRAEHAIDYLGRYVNKTAFNDERIKQKGDKVEVRVKNRKEGTYENHKIDIKEFIRRFLLHILPKGTSRIRYYGFLSCSLKSKSIKLLKGIFEIKSHSVSAKRLIQSLNVILLKHRIELGESCQICKKGKYQFSSIEIPETNDIFERLYKPILMQ